VRHGENVNPTCNRKSGHGNPSPTARRARFLSRPVQRIIDGEGLEMTSLGKGTLLMLDEEPVYEGTHDFWQYGPQCQPIPGIGVISGHDVMEDHFHDCPISLAEAREKIIFTKRIVRGHKTTQTKNGIVIERIAPIVEEK
jgi:hypothetical protein